MRRHGSHHPARRWGPRTRGPSGGPPGARSPPTTLVPLRATRAPPTDLYPRQSATPPAAPAAPGPARCGTCRPSRSTATGRTASLRTAAACTSRPDPQAAWAPFRDPPSPFSKGGCLPVDRRTGAARADLGATLNLSMTVGAKMNDEREGRGIGFSRCVGFSRLPRYCQHLKSQ